MSDRILYIEDDPNDVFFMQRAFATIAPQVELHVITNGQEAADFFVATKSETDSSPPLALVILDLNLPGRSGLDVLTHIRGKSKYGRVPVILFSASNQQKDIDACYAAGCNAYVIKPSDPERLRTLVGLVHDFWLKENRYSKTPGGIAIVST